MGMEEADEDMDLRFDGAGHRFGMRVWMRASTGVWVWVRRWIQGWTPARRDMDERSTI